MFLYLIFTMIAVAGSILIKKVTSKKTSEREEPPVIRERYNGPERRSRKRYEPIF